MTTKRVPVVQGFDESDPIGWMEVDMERLPARPNFMFVLCYHALEEDAAGAGAYELICVSPVAYADCSAFQECEQGEDVT